MEHPMPRGRKALNTKKGYLKSSTYATCILLTLLFGFIFYQVTMSRLDIRDAEIRSVASDGVLYFQRCPLGDPCEHFAGIKKQYLYLQSDKGREYICEAYKLIVQVVKKATEMCQHLFRLLLDFLYQLKIKGYKELAVLDSDDLCHYACFGTAVCVGSELSKDEVDKVIEDDLTQKLSEDLLQSIERKFQVDLQRSVDIVLVKIRLLLQNGTAHIQDSLAELQNMLDLMKQHTGEQVDTCLKEKQNETTALAENALHQMVVCGYALIGQDPSQAVSRVVDLKNMIRQGVKPIHAKKAEIDQLLKVCGHDHDSLKNVIKCVISKSPIIKVSMMEITGKLIEGVVELTKLMAHGAMHEACLIEVVKTLEDEAFEVITKVKYCAYGNSSYFDDVNNYIAGNNATLLDIDKKKSEDLIEYKNISNTSEMKELLRRMVQESKKKEIDDKLKEKILKLQNKIDDTNGVTSKL